MPVTMSHALPMAGVTSAFENPQFLYGTRAREVRSPGADGQALLRRAHPERISQTQRNIS